MELRPLPLDAGGRLPQVGERADGVGVELGGEIPRRVVQRVLVDQVAVHVADERRVQRAVVLGVRHHEGRGQRVTRVEQQPALAGVDLEDLQRVLQAAYLGPAVRLLDAR
ncbi:hypothetical protein WBK31_29595 [Nonomuraea sp. N2-4H]